jgi:hypothetical protein
MAKTRSALTLGFAIAVAMTATVACSDDAGDKLGARAGSRGSSGSTSSSGDGSGDPNDPNNPDNTPEEQKKFIELQAEFDKKCGNACHNQGTYRPEPPKFLAGATPVEVYKTIKAHPGIVTRDVYQSALLTKPAHAGPALNTDAELEKKIVAWLELESFAIQSQKLPSTEPYTVKQGANEIDLAPASGGKLTGVKMTFDASLVAGMLSLSQIKLVVPAGTDVHLQQPRFIRVLAQPKADGTSEVSDPADSFSNLDITVAQSSEAAVTPGSAFFSGDGWRPYDLAADKIRIEAVKLEPGKVQVIAQAATCKNVANFTANVLPSLRGQAGGFLNCANCHGNGLAGLSLNAADQTTVCNQVLSKLSAPPNYANSLIIQKINVGPHSGGAGANAPNSGAAWTALWTDNQAVFF